MRWIVRNLVGRAQRARGGAWLGRPRGSGLELSLGLAGLRPLLVLTLLAAGCRTLPAPVDNPSVVGHPSYDFVWETTVDVLEKYFDIADENRWSGWIETQPQVGAMLCEPWRPDSVDLAERLEASLQTIRRRAYVHIQPGAANGFIIAVEVYKELEDLQRPVFATVGAGSFISSIQPTREALVTSGVRAPAGWISLGRDTKLEARIQDEIQRRLAAAQDAGL